MMHRLVAGHRLKAIVLLTSLLLVLAQVSCTGDRAQQAKLTGVAQLSTVAPELAATLTAWPTPPPIITQPPTVTTAPQPVWTVSTLPNATESQPAPLSAAPGSKPPAVQLLIPKLGLHVPVVEVSWEVEYGDGAWQSVWQTADRATGHHRNSANPGEAGNVVISGHHNTRGEVFRQVSEIGEPGAALGIGDDIILVAKDGKRYTYTVSRWDRFREEGATITERLSHAAYLTPTSDATLTLVTCWPYTGISHRVVVIAKLKR